MRQILAVLPLCCLLGCDSTDKCTSPVETQPTSPFPLTCSEGETAFLDLRSSPTVNYAKCCKNLGQSSE